MEYFDIKKFENLEKDEKYSSRTGDNFYKNNNIRYRLTTYKDIMVEERVLNSPYTLYKLYDIKTNMLKSSARTFYGFAIEYSKEYDGEGKLIKEIDDDKPYQFSIEDLRKKLKNEYDIDIIEDYKDQDPTLIKLGRWLGYDKDWNIYKKNVPMYQVGFEKNNYKIYLEINAISGSTIKKQVNGVIEK